MCETLTQILEQKYGIRFDAKNGQVRCFAHGVNRIAQKILSALGDAPDPDEVDYYLEDRDFPLYHDIADDADVTAHEAEDTVVDLAEVSVAIDEIERATGELPTSVTKVCLIFPLNAPRH